LNLEFGALILFGIWYLMLGISLCEAQGSFDLHALSTPQAFILS